MRITSTGAVGIGVTNPASGLVVSKSTSEGRGGEISIINPATAAVGNEAALNFGLEPSTYNADNGNAQIKARINNASTAATDIMFSSWNGSAFGERMRISSGGQVLINRFTSGLQTFPTAKLAIGTGVAGGSEATAIHIDDMGARNTGTAQTIDFSMGRTNVTPDASKAQIVAMMEGNSATAASHGIGFELRTATAATQQTSLKIQANGSIFKFNTAETPQSGNPRTSAAMVIGPSVQGAITQGLTNATVLINRGGELYATDSSHNNTQLTPHNWALISDGPSEELAWTYWSQRPNPSNPDQLQGINVDIAKVARKVEDLIGEKLVYTENSNMDDHTHLNIIADIQTALANLTTRIEALEA